MCGILFSNAKNISSENFKSALDLMNHRGPDADGFLEIGPNKFGHKRLKILDLDNRSNQPFWDDNKEFVIIFNGEIYNYKELALKHKIPLKTTSDTELLLKLYIKIGHSMLNELNGMFAFVIYNVINKDLFIVRDRLGVKPLYITSNSDKEITVSSEIAPILSLNKENEIDDFGLRQYKKLRGFFNNRTLYKNIRYFPAGHYYLNGKLVQYWHLDFSEKAPPTNEELKYLIETAVKYRTISDVPVGSFLSGGLDSSIVATLAGKPDTWTIGFEDNNEFEFSQIVSERIHSNHQAITINKDEFLEIAKKMILHRKEPLAVPNEVLLYKMSKIVAQKNTVILCGEGADEMFFGYDRIFRWANQNKWDIQQFNDLYCYGSNEDYEVVEDAIEPFKSKHTRNIDIIGSFFQHAHLHNLLRRLDNATMYCSIEARGPFLDYRLIERMAGVSFDYKLNNNIVKAPLKRIFADILPKEVIDRKKVGFPVQLDKILGNDYLGNTGFDKWFNFNLDLLINS